LFDWLVTGQVIPSNPTHPVRALRHSVSKRATVVISSVEARELLDSMDAISRVDAWYMIQRRAADAKPGNFYRLPYLPCHQHHGLFNQWG